MMENVGDCWGRLYRPSGSLEATPKRLCPVAARKESCRTASDARNVSALNRLVRRRWPEKDAMQAALAGRCGHRSEYSGVMLRKEVLPAFRVPVLRAAEALGVSRQALYAIFAERADLMPEMAVRLG